MIEYDKYPSYMFEVYYSLNYLMTNMFVWSCLAKIQTLDLFLDCNTMSQEAPIAPSGLHFPFAAPRFQQVKICEAALGCVWHLGLCTKNQEFFQLNTFEGFRLHFCHHRRNPPESCTRANCSSKTWAHETLPVFLARLVQTPEN